MVYAVAAILAIGAAHAANVNPLRIAPAFRCTADPDAATTVPGWRIVTGSPALRCSDSVRATWPAHVKPRTVIANGPYGASKLERIVPLTREASRSRAFTLSAWFGVSGRGVAQAHLRGQFLGATGGKVGSPILLQARGRRRTYAHTRFEPDSISGAIPRAATALKLQLSLAGSAAGMASYVGAMRLTVSPPMAFPAIRPPRTRVPRFDHVFLIMMENTSYGQVIGDTKDAPYINAIAARGTLLANYQAVYHPSDENYLAIAGGDTFVKGAVYFPHIHVTARNIGDLLDSAGDSWKAYEQGMGKPCNTRPQYDKYYEADDAPFINFTNIQDNLRYCRAHLVDMRQWPVDLRHRATTPVFAWLAADDYDDGELPGNGSPHSLRVQDRWLRRTIEPLMTAPAWRDQRTLLILTWDESDAERSNHIATIVIGSGHTVRHGYTSYRRYDHYSTARTIEAALGLPSMTSNDEYAPAFNDAFTRH